MLVNGNTIESAEGADLRLCRSTSAVRLASPLRVNQSMARLRLASG